MSPRDDLEFSSLFSRSLGSGSVNDVVACMRNLQLNKVKSLPSSSNNQFRCFGFGSPRGSVLGPGFRSLPNTPTRPEIGYMDIWDNGLEEEPAMERVESGRELRAKMFEKLSKENCMDRVDPDLSQGSGEAPDVGWVSELVM